MNPPVPANAVNPEEHHPSPDYAVIDETEPAHSDQMKAKLKELGDYPYEKRDNLEFTVAHFKEQYYIKSLKALFRGTWLNGQPNGKGIFNYPDGSQYQGYVSEGLPNQKGRKIFANGDYYTGEFVNGIFEGNGEYHQLRVGNTGGVKLVGNFKNGLLNGEGKEQWPNNVSYNGQFKNGKKHGKGRLDYPVEKKKKKKLKGDNIESEGQEEEKIKEEYYEGIFENGEFNGKGIYVWSDGRRFVGRFKNGKMHGKGVFVWKDERKYEGFYFEDMKHGLGEYSWPDGRKWKGGWKNGLQHGRGVLLKKAGEEPAIIEVVKERGVWVNGKKTLSLKPSDEDWPAGVDEVDMNIFPYEADVDEEDIKSPEDVGKALFGKVGDLLGQAGNLITNTLGVGSGLPMNMDDYLKEYKKSNVVVNSNKDSNKNSPRGSMNGKIRDPKDNLFIKKTEDNNEANNNVNLKSKVSQERSAIRQEFTDKSDVIIGQNDKKDQYNMKQNAPFEMKNDAFTSEENNRILSLGEKKESNKNAFGGQNNKKSIQENKFEEKKPEVDQELMNFQKDLANEMFPGKATYNNSKKSIENSDSRSQNSFDNRKSQNKFGEEQQMGNPKIPSQNNMKKESKEGAGLIQFD